jgi:hypothetical protein
VVAVGDGLVAATRGVVVVVVGVDLVGRRHRVFLSLAWVTASARMEAMWSS